MLEAQTLPLLTQLVKLLGRVELLQHVVLGRGPQVLADGQQVAVDGAQVSHGLDNLMPLLAQADHHPGLGHGVRGYLLCLGQHLQRPAVAALWTHGVKHPLNGLYVVVEDVRLGVHHRAQGLSLVVRDEHLHLAIRQPPAYLADALGEDEGAAVGQVVTVDGGYDAVAQGQLLHRARQSLRLLQVEREGPTRGDGAVVAAAGAYVTQDHEGGAAPVPAVPDVGAAGLLADGVQLALAQQVVQLNVVGAAGHGHLEPGRQASARDLFRLQRSSHRSGMIPD